MVPNNPSWRRRLGWCLRILADRVDYRGAPRALGWWFTFEDRRGIVFREDGRGCRLWYLGQDDYERAHTESDTDHVRVFWDSEPLRAHIPTSGGER